MATMSVVGRGWLARRDVRLVAAVLVALALVLGAFMLIPAPAEAAPHAQIDFGNFICGILIAVAEAFDDSPFFSFIAPIINSLLAAFGCDVSPG